MKISHALIAVALATVTPSAEAATLYRLTDLGIAPGQVSSIARTISNSGAIGGESGDQNQSQNVGVRFDGGLTVLPTLSGGTNTVIRGINNSGTSAAVIQSAGGNDRAALLTTTTTTQLGGLAGFASAGALDVNNAGVATGYALISGGNEAVQGGFPVVSNARRQTAVVWHGGIATALSTGFGAIANSTGSAINESGAIAGNARLANNSQRGVLWNPDGSLTILALGQDQFRSRARAINDAGSVAGQVFLFDGRILGAVWSGANQFLLNPTGVGYDQSTTRGINSFGTVVGFANDSSGNLDTSGQIWNLTGNGYVATALDSLVINLNGWQTQAAQSINDRGQIVGVGLDPNGIVRAYLLTPVPEPASWAMMIAGFGIVGGAMRRRAVRVAYA